MLLLVVEVTVVTRCGECVVAVSGTGDAGVLGRVAAAVGLLVREGDARLVDVEGLVPTSVDPFLAALDGEVEPWAVTVLGDRRLVPA